MTMHDEYPVITFFTTYMYMYIYNLELRSCLGGGDDGGRVVGREGRGREGRKGALGGVMPDCDKSIRWIQ